MHRIRTLFAALSCALFLGGLGSAVFVFLGYEKGRNTYKRIAASYTREVETEETPEPKTEAFSFRKTASDERNESEETGLPDLAPPGIVVNFTGLQKENPDVVAWLYLPGLSLSYPVLQGEDNTTYLHRGIDGETLYAGSLFLEEQNSPGLENYHSIVYGHNMRDGTMFGRLKEYQEEETYKACPYFWLYLPGKAYLYRIFSVHTARVEEETYLLRFESLLSYKRWVADMQAASAVTPWDPGENPGKTVTLSTCTSADAYRQAVQGIQVYEKETKP